MNEDKWHVVVQGKSQGPLTTSQIHGLIQEGKIASDALAWGPSLTEWKPWKDIPAIAAGFQPKPAPSAGIPAPLQTPMPPSPGPGQTFQENLAQSILHSSWARDFISFRRMITPMIIIALNWFCTGLAILAGIFLFIKSVVDMNGAGIFGGLTLVVFGPLVIRVYSEVIIVFFRMNETLTDIAANTKGAK